MTNPWEGEFRDIAERYPGSSRPITGGQRSTTDLDTDSWDSHPQHLKVKGVEQEFFGIGDLAAALGRRPVTVRGWERDGVIPKATFVKPGAGGDLRGRRRLYSRGQVEGILQIASEEGLLGARQVTISKTNFTERVIALFKELRARG